MLPNLPGRPWGTRAGKMGTVHYSFATWWLYLLLFVCTWAVYAPALRFDFVNYDDPEYVTNNPHVRAGLTPAGLVWAVHSVEASNWFPLTRLSHMLDCQLFGLLSGGHHFTNILLHVLAAMLLLGFLQRATRALWPSALVAALFALHPLHVESVAWIAERKDVLSACFWFLTLWAYTRYTQRPGAGRYLLTILPFCLGLMAKPMIVTLPFILLLLDGWPLRRTSQITRARLLLEKLPFFALAAGDAVITLLAQRASGALKTLEAVPAGLRAGNALVSYVVYIFQTVWPSRLAVFYPYPARIPRWQIAIAALALVAISTLVLRVRRQRPYLAVGWFWYVVTLAPVIGLLQVGSQARADRYLYVPMVGMGILLSWGAAELAAAWPQARTGVVAVAVAICAGAAVRSGAQLQSWRNSESLFRHALAVTTGNYVAHHNLGNALAEDPNRLAEAIAEYHQALELRPDSAEAHSDLGTALAKIPGHLSEAIVEYEAAVRLAPDWDVPHNNLGYALTQAPDRLSEAIAEYRAALRINPEYAQAHNNLGVALAAMPGRLPEAIAEYHTALRLQPDYAEAHNNLGLVWARIPAHLANAAGEFQTAIRLKPDFAAAHNNLANIFAQVPGRLPEAIGEYREALRLRPDYAEAHYNLGVSLAKMPGGMPEALQHLETALRIRPDPQLQRAVDRLQKSRP
jgi:protein O-mannosyl-transferase